MHQATHRWCLKALQKESMDDLVSYMEMHGRRGVASVEVHARVTEMSKPGKALRPLLSCRRIMNDKSINFIIEAIPLTNFRLQKPWPSISTNAMAYAEAFRDQTFFPNRFASQRLRFLPFLIPYVCEAKSHCGQKYK